MFNEFDEFNEKASSDTSDFVQDERSFQLFMYLAYVFGVHTHRNSKSLTMMCELRKFFLLIGNYDINIWTF
jgi:hypothetical protein